MKIALVDTKGKSVVEFDVTVTTPVDALFVKDRQTKQNFLLIRSKGEDTTQTPRQLIPIPWDQYCGLYIKEIV